MMLKIILSVQGLSLNFPTVEMRQQVLSFYRDNRHIGAPPGGAGPLISHLWTLETSQRQ